MIQLGLDIDEFLSKTLIGLVLIGYVAIVYVMVIACATLPFGIPPVDYAPPWWMNLLVLVLLAATFLPVYRWVRAGVRELMYSQQDTSHPAVKQLHEYLASSPSPNDILPTIVETIGRTLKLPYVEIEIQRAHLGHAEESAVIAFGSSRKGAAIERVPLTYHDLSMGELRVSGRHGGEILTASDREVLHQMAQQVGIALYAAQLTEELQHAREQLVIAREEERRRIRNDLHDGLAPTLSSVQLQLGAARTLIRQNPEQAEAILADLRADMRTATAEIRRLVYDLRPPMLDELGLIGALRNSKFQGSDLRIEVYAPEPMPKLSAAVEVAVYRIAGEALHNVVKHAQATDCELRIEVDGECLVLIVLDNGTSFPADVHTGVGLSSMKERAAELGGTLRIQPGELTGTCVLARIPIGSGCKEA